MTKVQAGTSGHDKFAESSAILSAIGQGLSKETSGKVLQTGVFDAGVNAGNSLLEVPAAIIGGGQ